MLRITVALTTAILAAAWPYLAAAGETDPPHDIHLIWMGGDDCPPCAAWRAFELPKLRQSQEFKHIRFSYVIKAVKSTVPPRMFLPAEVAPLKEKLDEASGGRAGSPKGALVVDGEIYDFFQGTRTAEQISAMINAVRTGAPYPFKRCLKAKPTSRGCDMVASRDDRAQ